MAGSRRPRITPLATAYDFERQMTEMAGMRTINLKVLASIKPLGKSEAVTVKCEMEATIKVPASVSISGYDEQF